MTKPKLSPREIVQRLQMIDALTIEGMPVAEAVRSAGVLPAEYDRWRIEYNGLCRTLGPLVCAPAEAREDDAPRRPQPCEQVDQVILASIAVWIARGVLSRGATNGRAHAMLAAPVNRVAKSALTPACDKEVRTMIHELRIYRCVPNRLPALVKRFETATLRIWQKHGIRQAGFWTTMIGESNQELTYLLEWESLAEREQKWSAFVTDPEWIKARDETEKDGPIVATLSNSILQPTSFSSVR